MYPESEKELPALADHQGADPIPKAGKDPNNPSAIPTPHPTFPRLSDDREALKSPAGKIKISFPESCAAFASRIPADTICSPIMTQSLEGATVLVSLAPSSGDAWPPAPCPDGRASDPGTADGPAAPPPGALLPAAGLAAVCKHFLPPPPPPPGASQLERVGLAAGSALAVAPTRLPRPAGLGRGTPSGSGAAIGETQAPGAVGGRSGSPTLGQEGGQLAGRRRPCSLPCRYLLACGGVLGRSASPGAVSPRSCPCWLLSRAPCTGGGGVVGCSALLPRTAASRVNGSCRPASGAPQSPPGACSTPAPASPQTLRARGEREVADYPAQSQVAGPGGPATVPGRRPAPLEGRREGAGTAAATPGSLGAPSWGRPPGACHSPA